MVMPDDASGDKISQYLDHTPPGVNRLHKTTLMSLLFFLFFLDQLDPRVRRSLRTRPVGYRRSYA